MRGKGLLPIWRIAFVVLALDALDETEPVFRYLDLGVQEPLRGLRDREKGVRVSADKLEMHAYLTRCQADSLPPRWSSRPRGPARGTPSGHCQSTDNTPKNKVHEISTLRV